ncbi:MAG: hypothetical protein V8Q80_01085 [Barnesiella intestinihominis]
MPIGSWTQLTISAFANGIDVWTNGEKKWIANTGGAVIPETSEPFVIGENLKGPLSTNSILWKTEMPGAEPENLMFRNTVNKFHPKYDDLILLQVNQASAKILWIINWHIVANPRM